MTEVEKPLYLHRVGYMPYTAPEPAGTLTTDVYECNEGVKLILESYPITKHTPKGYRIIDAFGVDRFVLAEGDKAWAYVDVAKAVKSFVTRKQRHKAHMLKVIARIDKALALVEPDTAEKLLAYEILYSFGLE